MSILHRWKNYWIRGVLSLAMISGFFLIIYMGPITLILVVSDNIWCFNCCFSSQCIYPPPFSTFWEWQRLNGFWFSLFERFIFLLLSPSFDIGNDSPNQVFPRNYHHWLQSLPFLWTSLVQDTKLVRKKIFTVNCKYNFRYIIINIGILLREEIEHFLVWYMVM